MQLQLNKEEKLQLEVVLEKRNNLVMQDKLLVSEWNGIIKSFCDRKSADITKAKTINLETGIIEFEDVKKRGEAKDGRSKA
jgi:hypothetical protein